MDVQMCPAMTVIVALCPSHITTSGWACGFQIDCSIYEPGLSNSRLARGGRNIAHLAGLLDAIGPQRPSLLPAVNVPSESGTVLGLIAVKVKVDLFPAFHRERQ